MKPIVLVVIISVFPVFIFCQPKGKTKMILDKTFRIDSSLQPYFGIQRETIHEITMIDENALKENTENVMSSDLHATKDPFQSASAYQFSALHFRSKGLSGNYVGVTVNGLPMQDLTNGMGLWSQWQGLNAVFRVDENDHGYLSNSYAVALVGSTNNVEIRASKQKAQTNFDYGYSNRMYTHRFQFTKNAGILKNGWAYSISGGGQFTTSAPIPGTFNQAVNCSIGIDKQWGRQLFSLNFFATKFQHARQAYTLKESSTICNDLLYNPNWGYQQQQPRNANASAQFLPVLLLTHEWRISNQTYWQTSMAYTSGEKNATGLNWYHAPDPRPDYYRYLPSFQTDPVLKNEVTEALQNDINQRQINWDKLYAVNSISNETIYNADGVVGNTVSGKLARYMVENKKTDVKRFNFSTSYHGLIAQTILFDMGGMFSLQQSHYFKTINDLLGADFFVNWNQFAENELPTNENAIQFDLKNPNRILKKGDAFGYDYSFFHTKSEAWISTVIPFHRFQFSIASSIGFSQFWRIGNLKNGLFPDNSYGKSASNQFIQSGSKLGLNYAINGKQRIYLSAAFLNRPPTSNNVFISPSTRDAVQENCMNENVYATDMGYLLQTQSLKVHAAIYYQISKNAMDVLSFYHDGYNSFVNYAISGIGQTHYGYEFGMEAKLNNQMSVLLAATNGHHFYNSREFALVTADNSAAVMEKVLIYAKNYPAINSPQAAYSFSLNYRNNQQWFGSLSTCLFDRQWMGWNPIRRTAEAIYPVDQSTEKGQQLLSVERMPAIHLVNIFLSHSFRWTKKTSQQFSCSISVNNLLNNQEINIAANEQLRFDFDNKDPNKFPPKYLHSMGRNFLLSLHYSF